MTTTTNMTREDRARRDELLAQAYRCQARAVAAIDAGSSVGAREWLDAVDAALRAARSVEVLGKPVTPDV